MDVITFHKREFSRCLVHSCTSLQMLPWFVLIRIVGIIHALSEESEEECSDKSPYCNTNDCTVRPGYAIEYCKKTCGDCEPFCHNSHFVSCKESRKPECDWMLKDYCPLLCGACRPIKKKSSKVKGTKMSRTPLTIANLGIPARFPNFKVSPTNMPVHRATTISVIPATKGPSNSSENSSADDVAPVFRSPPKEEAMYPDPFVESVEPTSMPITVDEEDPADYVEEPTSTEHNATLINHAFPPEPMRIPPNQLLSQRPPARWRRPPERITPPWPYRSHERRPVQEGYHPAQPSAQWRLPHPHNPQLYPPFSFASPPRPFSRSLYSPSVTSAHLQGIQEPTMGFGDLVTLLGCRDRDPSICTQVTQESCLSRPGYYLKLCPVKCKNCNGLQCLDSIKLDCSEVRRLGGCKLPTAAEYCPRTCRLCALPAAIAETLPPCKDELDTCENLAESGVCEHSYSRRALRIYCAKSCGFCREPQYYMNDSQYLSDVKAKERLKGKARNPMG